MSSFTPTLTNATVGAGSVTGTLLELNPSLVRIGFSLAFGAGGAVTGTLILAGLPRGLKQPQGQPRNATARLHWPALLTMFKAPPEVCEHAR